MGKRAAAAASDPAPKPEDGAHTITAGQRVSPFARNFVLIFGEELMAKFYTDSPMPRHPNRQHVKTEKS
jgi:hypothetical protein